MQDLYLFQTIYSCEKEFATESTKAVFMFK